MSLVAVEARANPVSHKYATVDGIEISYREAGDPTKPTILLLHGFPSSSNMYNDLIPMLSKNFHLLTPDYQGMGYSEAPALGKFTPTFDALADVMAESVQQLGEKRLIHYTQDFGGQSECV
jgi:pimeloyl-ACP methyl ester carboxylesterase